MSYQTDHERLRSSEVLLAQYLDTLQLKGKFSKLSAFGHLRDDSDENGVLRVMEHPELVSVMLETLAAEEPVNEESIHLQTWMLMGIRIFCESCLAQKPKPPPLEIPQFKLGLAKAIEQSFNMCEIGALELRTLPLGVEIMKTCGQACDFFDTFGQNARFFQDIRVPKLLDALWASTFAPTALAGPSDQMDSAGIVTLDDLFNFQKAIIIAVSRDVPSWKKLLQHSVSRAVKEHGSEAMAHHLAKLCMSSNNGNRLSVLVGVASLLELVAQYQPLRIDIIKASVSSSLVRAYWAALREASPEEVAETGVIGGKNSPRAIFESLYAFIDLVAEDADGLLLEKTIIELLEEDYLLVIGKYLVTAQYDIRFREFSSTIRVTEQEWWEEFVWRDLPREAREKGCNWIRCPIFGMDCIGVLTEGPTPLSCQGCKLVFYCSMACQKLDWTQGLHRNRCIGKTRAPATSVDKSIKTL